MADNGLITIKMDEEIFCPPSEADNFSPRKAGLKIFRKWKTKIRPVLLDVYYLRMGKAWFETTFYSFNFRKLRKLGSRPRFTVSTSGSSGIYDCFDYKREFISTAPVQTINIVLLKIVDTSAIFKVAKKFFTRKMEFS